MRTDKLKKYLIPNIPYLFILWACLKLGTAYRLAAGADVAHKLMGLGQTIGPAFADFAPGLAPFDWLVGIVGAAAFRLLIYTKSKNAKKYRRDEEYGSARFGTEKDRDTPLTLADERIARAIRENNARLVIIDPVQAFLGADVDMNRANEVRPIFRSLGDIAQATGCAIVLIGHLNKAAGTQSTYRGLGSIDITAAVRSLLFIGKLKDSPTTRVLIHEKSSLAPPGQSLAFSLGDEKGFEWIGAYDITADELLAGTDTAKTESKTAQAQMLILELLADGKRMPSAELEKAVNERGISSRTMRTAKSRIGDRLVTEKDGTAWVCYLRD